MQISSQIQIQDRRGSALLLVLVVVMLLSYSCYAFVELMLVELEATQAAVSQVQLRRLADSGIEATAVWSRSTPSETRKWTPQANRIVVNLDGQNCYYSIVPTVGELHSKDRSYGVINESSKLNLNSLNLDDAERKSSRARLMALPQMTREIADAILDWIDDDDDASQFGAESSYYLSLRPPYAPRQGRLNSLDELLLIRGITSEILFGSDGRSGWSQFLTLHARESNLTAHGQLKIHLNSPNLEELFSSIEAIYGIEAARFVVGWRLAGSAFGSESQRAGREEASAEELLEERKERRIQTAQERLATQLGKSNGRSRSRRTKSTSNTDQSSSVKMKGGIDVSRKPAYAIRSVFDLIGTKVRIDIDRRDTILESPWTEQPAELNQVAAELEDQLTVNEGVALTGRVNINFATFEVLSTVPGISDALAKLIGHAQSEAIGNEDLLQRRSSVAWLITEQIIDLKQLRLIAPFITTGGDVFSGVSIGHMDHHASAFAVGFLFDGAEGITLIRKIVDFGPIPWIEQKGE